MRPRAADVTLPRSMAWREDDLHRWLARTRARGIAGTHGHDAALLAELGGAPVVCADQVVEGVHFESRASAALVGRKAACRAREIEVVRHYDQQLPRIQADPLLVHQVFLNVMLNAEQAVGAPDRPGRIEITTSYRPEEGWATVTLRDNGPGLSDRALPRIFEPFFTTKDVGQGVGLGLALAYGII